MNTKEQIMQVSLHLFSSRGFDAVSVSDIAERIGMTKGALYKHFSNKKAILDAIVSYMDGQSVELPVCKIDTQDESVDFEVCLRKIFQYGRELFRYWTENPYANAFRHLLTIEQYHDEEFLLLYRHHFTDGPILLFADMLKKITKEDARMCAMQFYSPFQLLYSYYDTSDHPETILDLLESHFDSFRNQFVHMNGLKDKPDTSRAMGIPDHVLAKLDEVSLLKGYLDAEGHLTLMPSNKIKKMAALSYLADRLPEDMPMDKTTLFEKTSELEYFTDPSALCQEMMRVRLLNKAERDGMYVISRTRPSLQALVQRVN